MKKHARAHTHIRIFNVCMYVLHKQIRIDVFAYLSVHTNESAARAHKHTHPHFQPVSSAQIHKHAHTQSCHALLVRITFFVYTHTRTFHA